MEYYFRYNFSVGKIIKTQKLDANFEFTLNTQVKIRDQVRK